MPDEPWGVVGDRSALITRQQNLRGQITASPTGRNLMLGSFVLALYTDDPADAIPSPPDGTAVLWDNSGTLTLAAFTRDIGWVYRTLT
jgi:hypothetical protein